MATTNSTLNKKDLKKALRNSEKQVFESSLPMSRASFEHLFDYLDEQLGEEICSDNLVWTKAFLEDHEIPHVDQVIAWLNHQGGYCDCEVLFTIEEKFEC